MWTRAVRAASNGTHAGLPHLRQKRTWDSFAGGDDDGTRPVVALEAATGDSELAQRLLCEQEAYQSSAAAQKLLEFRRKLPSFAARETVLEALRNNQARRTRVHACWLRLLCEARRQTADGRRTCGSAVPACRPLLPREDRRTTQLTA